MKHELSILIPIYNNDCRQQVKDLSLQAERIEGLSYEIVVSDDASTDQTIVALNKQIVTLPHVHLISRTSNGGRAVNRNFLAEHAHFSRLLFLDGGMSITDSRFLINWLQADVADVAYGGYTVGDGHSSNLRYLYEKQCAPMHCAEERRRSPFLHFHTCNFMVRRNLMLSIPFDERFRHYGYEDVYWGKQLRQAGVAVQHVDNPIGFSEFEDNAHFVAKTEEGLRTLHTFRSDLSGYSQMLHFTETPSMAPIKWAICIWHTLFGAMERRNLCGKRPSLRIFKIYRLGYFLTLKNQQHD